MESLWIMSLKFFGGIILSLFFGKIWYDNKVFGKKWYKYNNLTYKKISNKTLLRLISINFVMLVFISMGFLILHNILKITTILDSVIFSCGILLLFVLPPMFIDHIFSKKHFELFLINALYIFVTFLIISIILVL
jgi:uncharacterized membrane protein YcgQ (UPF0703/DUF1980 family)